MKRLMKITSCALCLFVLTSAASASTIAYWQFDEKSPGETTDTAVGAILDQTGNYDATSVAGPQLYSEGASNYDNGSALIFDSANPNALNVPTDSTLDNFLADGTSATIEMLIRTTDTGYPRLISKQKVYSNGFWYLGTMAPQNNGALRFESVATDHPNSYRDVRGVTNVADGEWHHVALVIDSDTYPGQTNVSMYVDYVLDSSELGPTLGLIANTEDIVIGARADIGGNLFTGEIDFVRLSDTALTSAEMINPVPEPGVLALLTALLGSCLAYRRRRAA